MASNLHYLGGGDIRIRNLKPAWASLGILETKYRQKGWGRGSSVRGLAWHV
jgi:hypothetical protein